MMNAPTQPIPPLSQNPYLVAVLLVASSQGVGPGPRIVFHYPPNPSLRPGRPSWLSALNADLDEELDTGDTESESDDDEDEDNETNAGLGLDLETDNPLTIGQEKDDESRKPSGESGATGEKELPRPFRGARNSSPNGGASSKHDDANGWDNLFGMAKDGLAKLLAPHSRYWNGKKFEVSLDEKCFVGCPVFCRKEGGWWKERKEKAEASEVKLSRVGGNTEASAFEKRHGMGVVDQRRLSYDSRIGHIEQSIKHQDYQDSRSESKHSSPPIPSARETPPPDMDSSLTPLPIQIPTSPPRPNLQQISGSHQNLEVPTLVPPSLQSTASNASTMSTGSSTSAYTRAYPLKVFNLVFVIAPPTWEHQLRVEAMYNHVAWPLAKLLKDTQKKPMVGESGKKKDTGWLEREVGRIEKLCAEARDTGVDYTTFWPTLIRQSPLAQAISTAYNAISSSGVANVALGRIEKDPELCSTFCVQIPQPISMSNAPAPNLSSSQNVPSLPLSTAALTVSGRIALNGLRPDYVEYLDLYDELGIETTAPAAISPHAAIILLREPSSLLKELSGKSLAAKSSSVSSSSNSTGLPSLASTPIAAPLSLLIPCLSPRRTLSQLTRGGLPRSISLTDAQILSLELIRQRAARAIPPLHASNTYVVNPNADMRKVSAASVAYQKRFGVAPLPSLGAILGKLSVTTSSKAKTSMGEEQSKAENGTLAPASQEKQKSGFQSPLQPWGALIPSKDHKHLYMNVLSWLMREGWIVQIRTFVWIRVPPEVKKAVATQQAEEERAKRADRHHQSDSVTHRKGRGSGDSAGLLSPALAAQGRSHDHSRPTSSHGSSSSTGSFRTVVSRFGASDGQQQSPKLERKDEDNVLQRSSPTKHISLDDSTADGSVENGKSANGDDQNNSSDLNTATLIPSPSTATTLERRWVDYMGTHLPPLQFSRTSPGSNGLQELQNTSATDTGVPHSHPPWWWRRLVRCFDGEVAVEDIPAIASVEGGSTRDIDAAGRESSVTSSARGRRGGKDRVSDSKDNIAAVDAKEQKENGIEWKWKRKFVDEVVEALRERGWAVVVRHW